MGRPPLLLPEEHQGLCQKRPHAGTAIMNKNAKEGPEADKKPLEISEEMKASFEDLKNALISAPVRGYPYFKGPKAGKFILDTDFSGLAMGGVLSQMQEGEEVVIAYGSRKLNSAEKNYPSTKGELAAGLYFMKYWSQYLRYGPGFLWRTDNQALRHWKNMTEPSQVIMRWLEELAEFPARSTTSARRTTCQRRCHEPTRPRPGL